MAGKIEKLVVHFLLCILVIIFLYPLLVTFTNSLMSPHEITSRYTSEVTAANGFDTEGSIHFAEMNLIPEDITLSSYRNLFAGNPEYLGTFVNSLKIVIPIVLFQLIIGITTAYAFEFGKFRFKEFLFFFYITVMFMPLQVTIVPNYMTVQFLGMNGSLLAIILPGVFSPFSVFLMRQYLKGIPKEYVEAAKIDGAGHLRIIISIVVPLSKPALAAMSILTFTTYWNLVEQAVIFIENAYDEPLSLYLSRMAESNMGLIFAASCFYMLPALIIFMYGRKELVSGLVNAAVAAEK